jgi:hypothetical protein
MNTRLRVGVPFLASVVLARVAVVLVVLIAHTFSWSAPSGIWDVMTASGTGEHHSSH